MFEEISQKQFGSKTRNKHRQARTLAVGLNNGLCYASIFLRYYYLPGCWINCGTDIFPEWLDTVIQICSQFTLDNYHNQVLQL